MARKRIWAFLSLLAGLAAGFGWGWERARLNLLEPELDRFPRLKVIKPTEGPRRASIQGDVARAVDDPADISARSLELHRAVEAGRFSEVAEILRELVRLRPERALEQALLLPDWAMPRALEVVESEWMRIAPDEAWRFIAEANPGYFASAEFAEAIATTGRFDLGVAGINRLRHEDGKRMAAQNLFREWGGADLEGFRQWVAGLEGSLKGYALAEVAVRDLKAGIQRDVSLQGLRHSTESNRLVWSFLAERLIAEVGYDHAKTMVAALEYSEESSAIYSWMARNAPATEVQGWLGKIENPTFRTMAVISAVVDWTEKDPGTAARLSLMGGNREVTANQLRRIMPIWFLTDPQGAAEFLRDSAQMDPSLRSELQPAPVLEVHNSPRG